MSKNIFFLYQLNSKICLFLCAMFLLILPVIQYSQLSAAGWGKTGEVINYEETTWNSVYIDLDKLQLNALIPNYSGGSLQNGEVSLSGKIDKNVGYVIATSYNQGFKPPKTLEAFVKMIQDANPNYLVSAIDSKEFGAKYTVDMIPIVPEYKVFWRFFSTNNRLIKMGSDDSNEDRRLYFFESIYLQ